MLMLAQEYQDHCDTLSGYCRGDCDDVTTSEVPLSVEMAICSKCGYNTVSGMESALMRGYIVIEDIPAENRKI